MDLSGVALGGLIGLAGSVIAAFVTLRTNRQTIEAAEARRHEDMRRELYPAFLATVDEATDAMNGTLRRAAAGETIGEGAILPADWPDRLGRATSLIDFVASEAVSTEARALVGAMAHLIHFTNRTRGAFLRDEPPYMTNEQMELSMVQSEIHARRIIFVNAARADLGLPSVEFYEPPRPPESLGEWFARPEPPPWPTPRGWRDRLRPVWRLLPQRIRGPLRRRFRRIVQGF
jgi:hypothetical protein